MTVPTRLAYLLVSVAMFCAMGVLKLANGDGVSRFGGLTSMLGNSAMWGGLYLVAGVFGAFALILLNERLVSWAYAFMATLATIRGLGHVTVALIVGETSLKGVFDGVVWLQIALGLVVASWSETEWHRYPETRTRKSDRVNPPHPPFVDHPAPLRDQIASNRRGEGGEDGSD